jgi:hypothetical protein
MNGYQFRTCFKQLTTRFAFSWFHYLIYKVVNTGLFHEANYVKKGLNHDSRLYERFLKLSIKYVQCMNFSMYSIIFLNKLLSYKNSVRVYVYTPKLNISRHSNRYCKVVIDGISMPPSEAEIADNRIAWRRHRRRRTWNELVCLCQWYCFSYIYIYVNLC